MRITEIFRRVGLIRAVCRTRIVVNMFGGKYLRLLAFPLVAVVMSFAPSTQAFAHSANESYVYFNVTDEDLSGRIEVQTKDLARAFSQGDESQDGWEQSDVIARSAEIFEYFEKRLLLHSEAATHPVEFTGISFLSIPLGEYAQLQFTVSGLVPVPDKVGMSYDFLFSEADPTHRGFALIESNTRTGVKRNESYISLIFQPGGGIKPLWLNGEPGWQVFVDFIVHGIWHIWLGFDHVLFLITLLLTSVMVAVSNRWEPAPNLREALKNTLVIVTVFTLAHSVTLGLAAFGVIRLPVVLVEAVIALSIAIVALGNLFPALKLSSWKVVLVFGLFHGFGFANVLAPLGLDPARRVIGLAAFNIGVEIGQIAIVIVVFPILFQLRRLPLYRPVFLRLGSVFLIGIALFWFVERTYDVLGPVRQTIFG